MVSSGGALARMATTGIFLLRDVPREHATGTWTPQSDDKWAESPHSDRVRAPR